MANRTSSVSPASIRVPNSAETCSTSRRFLIRTANVREATACRKSLGDLLVAIGATGYCSIETQSPARGRRGWDLYLVMEGPAPDGQAFVAWLRKHREVVDDLIGRYLAAKYRGEGGEALAALRRRIKQQESSSKR